MKILSLGLSDSSQDICLHLEQDCPLLEQAGFRVVIDRVNRGCYTFLRWNITEGELSFRNYERLKNLLKQYVCQQLADYVVSKEEKGLVCKIINDNFHYFKEEEREIIYNHAISFLTNENGFCDFPPAVRRAEILMKLQDYFEYHHELVLEGFITFRLKDYRTKLVNIVNKAVDEYTMDVEYNEFIRVLRYFVEVQEAQIEEVHVIIGAGGAFKLCDAFGKTVNNQNLENAMLKNNMEINYDDLLISALITIAPQNIMLHCAVDVKADDVIRMIKKVFEGRVIRCSGCDMCRNDIIESFTPV